ncbi:MAG: hypothetical protein ABIL58_29360 [Pseudomonadota bacterium]
MTPLRQIPPGQEGRIDVKVNTTGYGGQSLRQTVRIQTNDPGRPWISISMIGRVEKLLDIQPERIRLIGGADQTLTADVVITKRTDHPVTIEKLLAKNGRSIRYEWVQRCTAESGRCLIRVTNTQKEKGRYADVLYLVTDSDLRPTIPIFITGVIQ